MTTVAGEAIPADGRLDAPANRDLNPEVRTLRVRSNGHLGAVLNIADVNPGQVHAVDANVERFLSLMGGLEPELLGAEERSGLPEIAAAEDPSILQQRPEVRAHPSLIRK